MIYYIYKVISIIIDDCLLKYEEDETDRTQQQLIGFVFGYGSAFPIGGITPRQGPAQSDPPMEGADMGWGRSVYYAA